MQEIITARIAELQTAEHAARQALALTPEYEQLLKVQVAIAELTRLLGQFQQAADDQAERDRLIEQLAANQTNRTYLLYPDELEPYDGAPAATQDDQGPALVFTGDGVASIQQGPA